MSDDQSEHHDDGPIITRAEPGHNRVVGAGTNGKPHDYSRVFGALGTVFHKPKGSEAVAVECPFCSKDKFYLNVATGLYDCKKCQARGNITTYLTWLHRQRLEQTSNDRYKILQLRRGIAYQTLKVHELAFDEAGNQWLIPFKSSKGNVINFQRYLWDKEKPNKLNLPELPAAIYGFHKLTDDRRRRDRERPVFLCEGPFDAIALDYSIGSENRAKYVILALPGCFKEEWAEHFRGLKVRALFDNDDGGRQQADRVEKLLRGVTSELRLLRWPKGLPDGYDVNDLVRDPKFKGKSVVGWLVDHSIEVTAETNLVIEHGWDRKPEDDTPVDWVWQDHLHCGTYASFSGQQATMKSTIARDIIARYTRGLPMPQCERASMPAGHVIYVTAEDSKQEAWENLEFAGADIRKITVMEGVTMDGDSVNILERLPELEQLIRQFDVRFVVIDGQNSVVGRPNIKDDMAGRFNVTNKLHHFAQRLKVCLVGIRNEDKEGHKYGAASMSHMARCIWRTEPVGKDRQGNPYFLLEFEKVSRVSPKLYPPIPYSVKDCGEYRRQILWGKTKPNEARDALVRARGGAKK